jgi:hypothetical protein
MPLRVVGGIGDPLLQLGFLFEYDFLWKLAQKKRFRLLKMPLDLLSSQEMTSGSSQKACGPVLQVLAVFNDSLYPMVWR